MTSTKNAEATQKVRDALASLRPGMAHQAGLEPDPAAIFAPESHANALDPDRALVVGNRGVGKSFWSAVLAHNATRVAVAQHYPRIHLERIEAVLGFHEGAGKDDSPAPSPSVLRSLLSDHSEPEQIWRAVLIQALGKRCNWKLPDTLSEIIDWSQTHVERAERMLREADQLFHKQEKTFLIVFDALDRLGRDWETISALSEGLLRFALDVRGYRAIRAKIFMRTDQANDDSLFHFADASKIRAESVKLVWQKTELFGLLYNQLLSKKSSKSALLSLADSKGRGDVEDRLLNDTLFQERVFYAIAGEFMGAGAKRGRTYSWLYDHLADAFGETSPRSFLTALQKAAESNPRPLETAIDHNGIRAGVQDASDVRVTQLKEDYDWIDTVLRALEGLEVPCEPSFFTDRWRHQDTIRAIRTSSSTSQKLLPLELERARRDPEKSLLIALGNIGVVEFRTEDRINMPDIFRVAARIKRRGGVRPPERARRR